MDKEKAYQIVDLYADKIIDLNDSIWEFAELPFKEFKSAEKLCAALEAEGFAVERGGRPYPYCV